MRLANAREVLVERIQVRVRRDPVRSAHFFARCRALVLVRKIGPHQRFAAVGIVHAPHAHFVAVPDMRRAVIRKLLGQHQTPHGHKPGPTPGLNPQTPSQGSPQTLIRNQAQSQTQAPSQILPISFRYIPEQVFAERAFLPGTFNGGGTPYQGNTACIRADHASAMSFVRFERYWLYTIPLEIGSTYEYKVQVHLDIAGADCSWLTDPLNPRSNPADNNNSVLTVTDPMIFQPAQEIENGAFSAGLFSTQPFVSIVYHIIWGRICRRP